MTVATGLRKDFVDVQDVVLIAPNNQEFLQVFSLRIDYNQILYTEILTDDTVDNLYGPPVPYFEGNIMVTQPELTTWNAFFARSNGEEAKNTWAIKVTSKTGGGSTTYTLNNGKIAIFELDRTMLKGSITHYFKIIGGSLTVT